MAERATAIGNARNPYCEAALRMDGGEKFPAPGASMAKWFHTDPAAGFIQETDADGSHHHVKAVYRDSEIVEIHERANAIHKRTIARNIFGKSITG